MFLKVFFKYIESVFNLWSGGFSGIFARFGMRLVGGTWVASVGLIVYTALYTLTQGLFEALSTFWTEAPSALEQVRSVASAGMGSVDNYWLVWVNYILPIDFLCSLLCLYYTLWAVLFMIGLIAKIIDFIGDLPLT